MRGNCFCKKYYFQGELLQRITLQAISKIPSLKSEVCFRSVKCNAHVAIDLLKVPFESSCMETTYVNVGNFSCFKNLPIILSVSACEFN